NTFYSKLHQSDVKASPLSSLNSRQAIPAAEKITKEITMDNLHTAVNLCNHQGIGYHCPGK
ncbi:hypothetical protein LSH36_403g03044, partial [Paralvinella palmiformis]